ncbi:hypothetical protein DFH07DRAFT_959282 [Mycena maculata]|uniref:Uncharacterized protein n=1 Tax=Mycena maculata TaxID=230809 RepID=A0AAD7NDG2_9AGAR|nr:hypothetical protein DFH07DRAFT_959282 [Mycena maculata]
MSPLSDDSYMPSSEGPGTTWCISQAHQDVYNERKRERQATHMEDGVKRRKITSSPLQLSIKQEQEYELAPCVTPRPTALRAKNKFAQQFDGLLNSLIGDGTYVENLLAVAEVQAKPARATFAPVKSESVSLDLVDEADIDLLCMRCLDAEVQRDDAIDAHHDALDELRQVRAELYQALHERDTVVAKQKEWEEAVVSRGHLIRLPAERLKEWERLN